MDSAVLQRRNDWWTTGRSTVGSAYKVARDELKAITAGLDSRRIQLIIGPRRVGKSTLMQQAISHLINAGVDPLRILFFSGDDPTIFNADASIDDVISCYLNEVLHEALASLRSRIYIFIDEIHTINGWQLWLKNYYEPMYNMKFVVSGSSASHLFDGASESLMGRTDTLRLMPLNFHQFCAFWAAYKGSGEIMEFVDALPKCSLYVEPCEYFDTLESTAWRWEVYKPYVNAVMDEYLLIGGYPEYFSDTNTVLWQRRLVEDIIGLGLYRDIISIYRIKTPDKLEKLLFFIADNNGQDFNMKTIADTIGCDNETVSVYLTYLSQAYMTMVLSNYATNAGKVLRRNKAIYVLDNGIANALLRLPVVDDTKAGHIVESICARDALAACENNLWSLHYWREKGAEVDLVLDRKTNVLPIEVKYRGDLKQKGLKAFREAFANAVFSHSVMITKDRLDKQQDVLYIPFWLAH